MIKQGTSGNEAEIPFSILTGLNAPVVGYSFSAGNVKVRLPGATTFVNASTDNISEVGNGQYVLKLTSIQTSVKGTIIVKFSDGGTNRDFIGYDVVTDHGQSLLELPFEVIDSIGDGVDSFSFSAGQVQVRQPGSTFANATLGNVTSLGEGQYVLALTTPQQAIAGAWFIYFDDGGTNRTYYGFETNIGVEPTPPGPDPTPPIPVPNPDVTIGYSLHGQAMIDRLCEYSKQDVL